MITNVNKACVYVLHGSESYNVDITILILNYSNALSFNCPLFLIRIQKYTWAQLYFLSKFYFPILTAMSQLVFLLDFTMIH